MHRVRKRKINLSKKNVKIISREALGDLKKKSVCGMAGPRKVLVGQSLNPYPSTVGETE